MKPDPATGIVFDPRYFEHRTADGHPESHRRLQAIYNAIDLTNGSQRMVRVEPRASTIKELELVHTPEYVARIASTETRPHTALTADTHASAGSFQAASLAVGGLFEAVEQVVSGHLKNAFALIRPPGHHAEKSRAMGFCLFNNIALAACYARRVMGLERVLIFDWDVHHGNGTQHIFENDPTVFFFSIHQYPHFPGTGFFTEAGRGRGEGYTVNVPLPGGYGDGEYLMLVEKLLRPMALEFNPQLILVSAGFDIHRSDPLGGMRLTRNGLAALTRSVMQIAETCCSGKLVMTLEGGYNVKTVGGCFKATIDEMADRTVTDFAALARNANPKKVGYALKRCIKVQQRFWHDLSKAGR
jgi:acetoin utilization deacetylase AcuC-like enzyme